MMLENLYHVTSNICYKLIAPVDIVLGHAFIGTFRKEEEEAKLLVKYSLL
jgi:hypothetical protein